eukprot:Nk52_evm2s503 gene=Nk52_evmTU2s503
MKGDAPKTLWRKKREHEALMNILAENPDYKFSLYRRKFCPLHYKEEACQCMEEHKLQMKKERNARKTTGGVKLRSGKTLVQGSEKNEIFKDKFRDRQLNPWAFLMVNSLLGPVTTDLFASPKNLMPKVKEYYCAPGSKAPYTTKRRGDAFQTSWSFKQGRNLYMNPVYSDKEKVLKKLKDDQALAIVVAPHYWRNDLGSYTLVGFSLPKAVDIFLPKGSAPSFTPTVFYVDFRNESAGRLRRVPFLQNDFFVRCNFS